MIGVHTFLCLQPNDIRISSMPYLIKESLLKMLPVHLAKPNKKETQKFDYT